MRFLLGDTKDEKWTTNMKKTSEPGISGAKMRESSDQT